MLAVLAAAVVLQHFQQIDSTPRIALAGRSLSTNGWRLMRA